MRPSLQRRPELVFLNIYGAQESMPRHQFRQPMYCSLAGRYDNPIPTRCLAPIDFLKIPVPEIIDPVFTKTSQNARFLLSENERLCLFSCFRAQLRTEAEKMYRPVFGEFGLMKCLFYRQERTHIYFQRVPLQQIFLGQGICGGYFG